MEETVKDLGKVMKNLELLLRTDELDPYLLFKHEHYIMGALNGLTGDELRDYVYTNCLEYLRKRVGGGG